MAIRLCLRYGRADDWNTSPFTADDLHPVWTR
jgi:hypothetical protein